MRDRDAIATVRLIAVIRDAQRVAAEAEAARAAARLRETDDALAASERQRQALEASWHAALSASVMRMETMPLWSAAVQRQDARTRDAAGLMEDAAAALERRKTGWRTAVHHADLARDMVERAVRDRRKGREETALHAVADLHLQRKGGA